MIAVGALLIIATTLVHGLFTVGLMTFLRGAHADHWSMRTIWSQVALVSGVVVLLFLVTVFEASLWAAVYLMLGALQGFEAALYFSLVTFTTLGYGDVTLGEPWRLLAAFQATDGIIKFGWTTAILVAFLRRIHETKSAR